MRFRPAPLLALALLAGACSHVPLASLPKLARLDPVTADLAALRAAARAPEAIMPTPGGAVLTLSYWRQGEEAKKTTQTVVLDEDPDPAMRAALKGEETSGTRITVFRLPEEGRRRLEAARAEAVALKGSEAAAGRKARGSLSIAMKGCARGPLPAGPILLSTYLKMEPEGEFIPLVRDVDLATLADEAGAKAPPIVPCPAG